ncbi:unnamed protein product [Rotaria sp. Silwood1]|nr:unnamed protein product [Rotaria sp. Silwood1]
MARKNNSSEQEISESLTDSNSDSDTEISNYSDDSTSDTDTEISSYSDDSTSNSDEKELPSRENKMEFLNWKRGKFVSKSLNFDNDTAGIASDLELGNDPIDYFELFSIRKPWNTLLKKPIDTNNRIHQHQHQQVIKHNGTQPTSKRCMFLLQQRC